MTEEPETETVLDRKRALEEDEAELIVTDQPELFEGSDEPQESISVKVVDDDRKSCSGTEEKEEQIPKENKASSEVKDRKPFKRSKSDEKNLSSATVHLRLLIPTNYSGMIIGKSGAIIAEIQQKSDAKVVMSELINAAPDRILTCVGMPEEVAQAIYEVAKILIRAENQQYKTNQNAYQKLTMRFLIPDEIMGAIIGKKAVKVKEIQTLSNSRVSAEQGLLIDSTERKMNVTGDADSIRAAVALVSLRQSNIKISQVILEFPASVAANIPFRPRPFLDSTPIPYSKSNPYANTQMPHGQSSSFNPYAAVPHIQQQSYYTSQEYPQSPYAHQHYSQSAYMGQPYLNSPYPQAQTLSSNNPEYGQVSTSHPYANNSPEFFPNNVHYPTHVINVPSQYVGALIGKAGRHINEMRRVSRCEVEVVDLAPGVIAGPLEGRQFKITGPPHMIAVAAEMIGSKLESEKKRIAKYGH
jgi:predicted RNA-binding protein YlqC (UPF0109 family)